MDVWSFSLSRFRRQVYVTPKSFLTFLSGYKLLYKQRLDNINTLSYRMSSGLSKLVDAAAQVDELRKVLEKNQQEIAEKNVQVEAVRIFFILHLQVGDQIMKLSLLHSYFWCCYYYFVDFSHRERKEERGGDGESTSASF